MKELLQSAAVRAARYLEGLDARTVAPREDAVQGLQVLDRGLPQEPRDPREVLALLDEVGSPATVASAGPRYFGYVTGGCLPAALAANWLAGAWDQNAFSVTSSPVGAAVEEIALRWLLEVLGLPPDSGGAFVTGATMANFAALAAGRNAVLRRAGWDVQTQGLFGAPPIAVVIGAEVHTSVLKVLGLLGLGRERVLTVPVDTQGRMRAEALPRLRAPAIVCTQAGNVNTGAFDPLSEICERAGESGAWVHVDGAFGLWAAAAPTRAHLAAGVAQAHSWATDAHKWLNVPYDCGLAFVRDAEALPSAMSVSAAYLPERTRREPMHYTPEISRRMRGLEVYAALLSLGRDGLAELIECCCRHAARLAEGLREAGYAVLNEVVLNQVLVSFGDDDLTQRVVSAVQAEGTCWCGPTVWQGRTAMRISVCSWATGEEDIERSLAALLRVASAAAG